MQIRRDIPEPRRMHTDPKRRNPSKYYLYHKDHGHDTEECIQLWNEIEKLIHHGKLDQFLWRQGERHGAPIPRLPEPPPRQEEAANWPTQEDVNMILGGSEDQSDIPEESFSKGIVFTPVDAVGV